jgi:hypothetical protein
MNKYKNEEEQIKANKVRRLQNKSNELENEEEKLYKEKEYSRVNELRKESKELYEEALRYSEELVEYLKLNYPHNFNTNIYEVYSDNFDIIEEYKNKTKVHDISFLYFPSDYKNIGYRLYSIFNDGDNTRIKGNSLVDYIKMPDNFYGFLETMGIYPSLVTRLYDLSILNKIPEYQSWVNRPNFVIYPPDNPLLWPNKVHLKPKLS